MLIEINKDKIFNRFEIVVLLFSLCFVIAMFAMLKTCYVKRNFYLEECSKVAWISKTIPAGRGAIMDKNKIPLAWTERHYDLHVTEPLEESDMKQLISRIEDETGLEISRDKSTDQIIKLNLSPKELLNIKRLSPKLREKISVKTRLKRNSVDYPEIKMLIGTAPDERSGASGLEAIHDKSLRGQDGIFRVMLDRRREWIPRSFEWIMNYKKGNDIHLDCSLEDIRLKAEALDSK